MSCSMHCRHGLDPLLLWLRHRPTAAALIQPRGWQLPNATGAALKEKKKKRKEEKKKKIESAYSEKENGLGIMNMHQDSL